MIFLRTVYIWLVSVHPKAFRERFSAELISIFDEGSESLSVNALVRSMAGSVFRQWARVLISGKSLPACSGRVQQHAYLDLTSADSDVPPVTLFCGLLLATTLLLQVARHAPQLVSREGNSVVTIALR